MKIKKFALPILVGLFFIACGSTNQVVEANTELDSMMQRESFQIDVKAAEPQVTTAIAQIGSSGMMRPGNTISRIDVTGEGYFVKLDGENVSANLPYYGERQMGGGYGSDTGITFDTTVKDLQLTKNEETHSYVVTFSVDNTSESYFFTIDVGASLNSTTRVRSSHRNRIRYTGVVKELED